VKQTREQLQKRKTRIPSKDKEKLYPVQKKTASQ
jgi:hypothetical protein